MSLSHNSNVEGVKLPDELFNSTEIMLKQWDELLVTLNLDFQPTPELSASFLKVWASSLFVSESCLRRPDLLIDLGNSGDLLSAYKAVSYTHLRAHET
jgi:glutamate-ammonia-ligase adenylyltransferase